MLVAAVPGVRMWLITSLGGFETKEFQLGNTEFTHDRFDGDVPLHRTIAMDYNCESCSPLVAPKMTKSSFQTSTPLNPWITSSVAAWNMSGDT